MKIDLLKSVFIYLTASLKVVTIFTFLTLILVGSSVLILIASYFYTNLQNKRFRLMMAALNLLNCNSFKIFVILKSKSLN